MLARPDSKHLCCRTCGSPSAAAAAADLVAAGVHLASDDADARLLAYQSCLLLLLLFCGSAVPCPT